MLYRPTQALNTTGASGRAYVEHHPGVRHSLGKEIAEQIQKKCMDSKLVDKTPKSEHANHHHLGGLSSDWRTRKALHVPNPAFILVS